MFVILWEFEVKPGSESAFETAYGPLGDWHSLFQRDPHYRKTYLLRDTSRPRTYFTMDLWDSEDTYDTFKNVNREVYDALDLAFQTLTLRERFIAAFQSIELVV